MATKVHMEALSPTMEEGRLVKWTKKEGDAVKSGDTLAEVETDKAVMELVARTDGQLLKVLVQEGSTVPVGNIVAWIGKPGEKVDGVGSQAVGAGSQESGAGAAPAAAARPARAPATPPPAPAPTARPAAAPADATRVKASPLARRIAKDAGVDLKLLQGSGPGGRVIKRDVEGGATQAQGVATPTPSSRLPAPGVPYEDVPLSQIRKTIAKRLAASIGPVPHFFLTSEVDMERAAEAREALNKQLGEGDAKISFNDIIIKAVALALAQHRACNAWFQDDHIRYWNEVHIGMAVAIDDGLITPVIRNADGKSLREIGAESRELASRARNRRLKPEEYTGATFSVSNLGMFDIDQFTAVINPPEAGIVAIGSIVPKTVPDGERIVVRRRMRLTMSCDHRVIDGATGAAFLKTLKQMLENPLAMLL
ncbi:MAG TPA: dihydrolipoamide acetyltransferase family protein [Gemmatimonadales bacterium]|nr:dihydrolipoamide acetyltransferase family protein [Gemmatimonadales bacterium]